MGLQEGRLLVGLGHVPDLLVEGIPVYKCTVITGYVDRDGYAPAREGHHASQLVLGVQRRVEGEGPTLVSGMKISDIILEAFLNVLYATVNYE